MSALSTLKDHVIQAIATAAVLGGGTAVVTSTIVNARQDQQIAASAAMLPEIQKDVKETREAVIRIEAKQDK